MKENTLSIIINRPIAEVFAYSINPQNTPKWFDTIAEEVAEVFPPVIGTQYKNRRENGEWNYYKVAEYLPNQVFALAEVNGAYKVRYIYTKISEQQTELTYTELVENGEITHPATIDILEKLKNCMEENR